MEEELSQLIVNGSSLDGKLALLRYLRKTHLRRPQLVVDVGREIAESYRVPMFAAPITETERTCVCVRRECVS